MPPSADLPLLPGGDHVGMIVGFNPSHPVATAAAIDARWREAVTKGMKIGRVQMDWVDLEPAPNVYKKEALRAQLATLSRDGLAPFLSVISFENDELPLPSDLAPRIASGELGYDSPEVLERHAKLLDWVVPLLREHHGWALALGNEPGNFLENLPTAADREKVTAQILGFVAAARAKIHALEPKLAVTVTVSEGRNPWEIANGVDLEVPFLKIGDVASFNFYGTRFDEDLNLLNDTDPARLKSRIDAMLAGVGDLPVVFQELGAQAGPDAGTSVTGSSLASQQQFFEVIFGELRSRAQLRAAYVFQLVDWSPALVEEFFSAPFRRDGVPESFIRQYAESLETVGLIRYRDGTARPAWNTFLDAL
ncbi:MAG: hypothetical protein R3B48_05055 [Kofleriaceae bacterium]